MKKQTETTGTYMSRMDRIFQSNSYKHRTLRTLFDPHAAEWNHTSMDEKVSILKRIMEHGNSIHLLAMEFQMYHKEIGRNDIARSATWGLADILQYMIENNKTDPAKESQPE